MSEQQQDVYGHPQTHLGWASRQSGKKEADGTSALFIIIRTHCGR